MSAADWYFFSRRGTYALLYDTHLLHPASKKAEAIKTNMQYKYLMLPSLWS